jgi:CreA protein
MKSLPHLVLVPTMLAVTLSVSADEIGSVDTKFILLGPDHKIVVDAFDDPKIRGVACFLSRAKTGGIKGALGVAEDTSDASISCRQVGPIEISDDFEEGERVFTERRSLIFKKLQVVRFCDTRRNAIVYLAYSDRIIEGSPQNSVSAVPIMPWGASPDNSALAVCRYAG